MSSHAKENRPPGIEEIMAAIQRRPSSGERALGAYVIKLENRLDAFSSTRPYGDPPLSKQEVDVLRVEIGDLKSERSAKLHAAKTGWKASQRRVRELEGINDGQQQAWDRSAGSHSRTQERADHWAKEAKKAQHERAAIADKLGGRILLSVPLLVMEEADTAFASMIRERGAERCVECELTDSSREIQVRLVFAPGPKS